MNITGGQADDTYLLCFRTRYYAAPTTPSLLWPGPKSEENLWENIDDTSPKAKCGGDGTIESFLDDPTKSGTQHKRIIL